MACSAAVGAAGLPLHQVQQQQQAPSLAGRQQQGASDSLGWILVACVAFWVAAAAASAAMAFVLRALGERRVHGGGERAHLAWRSAAPLGWCSLGWLALLWRVVCIQPGPLRTCSCPPPRPPPPQTHNQCLCAWVHVAAGLMRPAAATSSSQGGWSLSSGLADDDIMPLPLAYEEEPDAAAAVLGAALGEWQPSVLEAVVSEARRGQRLSRAQRDELHIIGVVQPARPPA